MPHPFPISPPLLQGRVLIGLRDSSHHSDWLRDEPSPSQSGRRFALATMGVPGVGKGSNRSEAWHFCLITAEMKRSLYPFGHFEVHV